MLALSQLSYGPFLEGSGRLDPDFPEREPENAEAFRLDVRLGAASGKSVRLFAHGSALFARW